MDSTPRVSFNGSKSKSKVTPVSQSKRAGLQFPVGRVKRFLKEGKYAARVQASASVYLAALLEYMAIEVLQLSGNEARSEGKSRIVPRHIEQAIRNDPELSILLDNVTIPGSGNPERQPKSIGKGRDIGSGSK